MAQDNIDSSRLISIENLLAKLDNAVQKGDLNNIKVVVEELHETKISDDLIARLYNLKTISFTQNSLIKNVLAAKIDNKRDILRYLLNDTTVLYSLTKPYVDEKEVEMQRTKVFSAAINLNDSKIIEMLYEFWCQKIHWTGSYNNKNNITDNIKRIGCSLDEARKQNSAILKINQQLEVDIHCLCKFNSFQNELYSGLMNLKSPTNNNVILTVLNIYEKYSCINMVRLPKSNPEEEQLKIKYLSDKTVKYDRALAYVMYELYFRKLDFNVSLLLLDNWAFLEKKLITQSCQIESKIYYFIFCSDEDWRLYLPKYRVLNEISVQGHDAKELKLSFDVHRICNGLILFYERDDFEKTLTKCKASVDPNLTNQFTQNINPEDCTTYLTDLLPYMREAYLLQRNINIVETVTNDEEILDKTRILGIEQAIQRLGEMFNTSKDCESSSQLFQFSKTTMALIEAELSTKVIDDLIKLRNYVSHTQHSKQIAISTRIDATEYDTAKYQKALEDIRTMKDGLYAVQDIHGIILNKKLVEYCLKLLEERNFVFKDLDTYMEKYTAQGYEPTLEQIWLDNVHKPEWNKQHFKEYFWMRDIKKKLMQRERNINNHDIIIKYLNHHFLRIKHTLLEIQNNNKTWQDFKHALSKTNLKISQTLIASVDPKQDSLNKITNRLKKYKQNELLEIIENTKDYSDAWSFIIYLSLFYVKEINYLQWYQTYINESSKPDENTIKIIYQLISDVENASCNSLNTKPTIVEVPTFDGICELKSSLMSSNNGISSKTDCEKILSSLTTRLDMLKSHLQDTTNIPLRQHAIKYNRNLKFRIVVDGLMADIFNIFKLCQLNALIIKTNKQLAGYNLRNILHHGNPLLEVIGDILDCHDYATEIMSKAIEFVNNDKKYIKQVSNTKCKCLRESPVPVTKKGDCTH